MTFPQYFSSLISTASFDGFFGALDVLNDHRKNDVL
jgi:hypothetical protein